MSEVGVVSLGQELGVSSGYVLAKISVLSFHLKSGEVSVSIAGVWGIWSGEGLLLHEGKQ